MIAPCGIEIKVGQVWEEVDPRQIWQRKVLGFGTLKNAGKVQLVGTDSGRISYALLGRFNGKRGGYRLVKEASDGEKA